jgi:N-acyl-D-aspartate/D-glutamate deacylase
MQPIHATSDMHMADEFWGARTANAYGWRTQLTHGAVLAFGSDAPVEMPNPFWGLHAAITRQRADGTPEDGWHPEQRLTLREALRAYTQGPAFAAGMEDRLGKLAPGYLADLLVLDPPKLIRSRAEFEEGRRVYYDMNRTAMAAVRKGGFLFSFSCSGLLGEEAFLKMLREAAWAAGRQAQVLRLVGAAPDHPFLLTAPEGRYLKGALLRLL